MRAVVLVLVVAACGRVGFDARGDGGVGGGDGDVDPPTSGSRLKVKWFELDGVRQVGGIYDSAVDKDCFPLPTTEGLRCIPLLALAIVGYSDAACTQPVGFSFDSSCPTLQAEYFLEIAPATCTVEIGRVFSRGASLGVGNVYVNIDGQSCIGPFAMEERIALGAEVPLADLAAIDMATPVGVDRLLTTYLESPDGFRVAYGTYDSQLDASCFLQAAGSRDVCAPESSMRSVYADAACTMPIGIDDQGCAASRYIERTENNCLDAERTYHERGAMIPTPSMKYSVVGASCVMNSTSDVDAFALGAEVSVAEITRSVGTTGGRIRALSSSVGAANVFDAWYDTMLGVECYPEEGPSGVRCIPDNFTTNVYYTDAACTNRVDIIEHDGDCDLPRFATVKDDCGVTISAHEVGAITTATLYRDNTGSCTMAIAGSSDRHLVGPPLSLASGTVSIDP